MIIGEFSDISSGNNSPLEFEIKSNSLELKRDEIEFLCDYKFENDKIWTMFQDHFFSDFLIRNKILLMEYCSQIRNDYFDVISRN